jgi:predicted metal-dependent hydrolase
VPTRYAADVDAAQREQLERGIDLYNRGEYFAAQEHLEAVLNSVGGDEQALVRALVMVACGMHLHFHRGGGRGALNLFRQGLMILDDLRPECQGVATSELYDGLEAYLQDLQDRRKPGAGFFDRWLAPRIRYR